MYTHFAYAKLLCNKSSNSSRIFHSCMLTMDAAVVYTVIVDSLYMRVVLTIDGTGLAELAVHIAFSRVSPVTGVSGSRVQLFVQFTTA